MAEGDQYTDCDNNQISTKSLLKKIIVEGVDGGPCLKTCNVEGTDVKYIDCDSTNLSIEDIFKKLVVEDVNGNPCLRICGGGDIIPPIELGYDIFVLGGQSNALKGLGLDGSDVYPNTVFMLGAFDVNDNIIIPAVEPIEHFGAGSTGSIGPMRTFLEDYISNGNLLPGREILIIGGAVSGSGFFDNRWNKGDDLYENLVARTNLGLTNSGAILKGIFMQMGERDSQGTDEEWEDNLRQFSLDFKADTNTSQVNTAFIIGGMPPEFTDVNQARMDIEARSQIVDTFIEYSDYADSRLPTPLLDTYDNGLHYLASAQRELGHRYYDVYLSALANGYVNAIPEQVTSLQSGPLPNNDINLLWVEPNAYPYISGYNVYFRVDGTTPWTLFGNVPSVTEIVTGLTENETYNFKVNAVNFEGESLDGNIVTEQALLNPVTYTHEFRYLFENNTDDGNNNVGVPFGTINYLVDGTRGNVYDSNAVAINGIETNITIPANSDWSKTCWVRPISAPVQHIMSSNDANGTTLMLQSGKIRVGIIGNDYLITQSTSSSGWRHVCVTYDAITDLTTLYVDNVIAGTATIADEGTHELVIGNKNGHILGFLGYLDDARLFLKVLTPAERLAVFNDNEI